MSLRAELDECFARAKAIVSSVEAPARRTVEGIAAQVDEKEREAAETKKRFAELGTPGIPFPIPNDPKTSEARKAAAAELKRLDRELRDSRTEYQKAQGRLPDLLAAERRQAAPTELQACEAELQSLLDRIGAFERETVSGVGEQLLQKAAAFRANTGDFTDAEASHKFQATAMLVALIAMLVVALSAAYFLFISPVSLRIETPNLYADQSADTNPRTAKNAVANEGALGDLSIDRVIAHGVGRLAILFFLAWMIKYLAKLHTTHAAQAVTYRDRRAALGVAELLLNATPELEQKREILRRLAAVYIATGATAFGSSPESDEGPLDLRVGDLKRVADALAPAVDAVSKLGGRKE